MPDPADPYTPAELHRVTTTIAERFRRLIEDRAVSLAKSRGCDNPTAGDVLEALEDLETCEIDVDDLIEVGVDDDDEER